MNIKNLLLTTGFCFGAGLALAPTMGVAQACSCIGEPFWKLEREAVEGDGDASAEEEFWEEEMWLHDGGQTGSTEFNTKSGVEWRRL